MLRRPPTAIKLTTEDLLSYDDEKSNLQHEMNKLKENEREALSSNGSTRSHDGVNYQTQLHLSKDERIGITKR
ncbi:hypothetical protein NADFUDRAFT_44724 [Nadsonia fulvescens var. elongata DSM 6958]|uniref:Uncharacterized protein n=1 Tax=Nadsonia fulvescens var. elongata DSM 6958 TaxID=857566 RepID=A0A1E3PT96_9ASCO|nr:hypothetical protein NADFUDRAFT_44724 [Nadsonia fulvescens var. elongata DSM 6958]